METKEKKTTETTIHVTEHAIDEKKTIKKSFLNPFTIIIVVLLVAVIGLVGLEQSAKTKPQVKTITVNKQMLVRRSKDPGIIARGLTGKAVDVNTGKIVVAARVFSPNDNTVYMELDLQQPPVGTLIDYLRYKDGKYVDHGEISISKGNTKDVLFNWQINKLLAGVTNGNWKVATYTNGILAKRILYQITNNKISYVQPDTHVSSSDPDYHLSKAVVAAIPGKQ